MRVVFIAVLTFIAAVSALGQGKQLPGSTGVIGTPYRVGPMQFILTGASFATRFVHAEGTVVAEPGKKLLILNYTVQNPGKTLANFNWATIRFTVVGAENSNHEDGGLAVNPDKLAKINVDLKPVQKIPVISYVEVPANDTIPKLMVVSENGGPVVRFDLKGKIKKHVGPYSADGVKVLDVGVAKVGEAVEVGSLDLTIDKVEDVTASIGEHELEEGKKFIVVSMTIKNPTLEAVSLDWGTYETDMKDDNDESVASGQLLLRGVGNANFAEEVKPGQTAKARMIFIADKGGSAKYLTLKWTGNGRAVKFSLK